MHTITVITAGFVLLGMLVAIFRWFGSDARAARRSAGRLFLPLWLAATLVNMWFGVAGAGYTVAEEIPIQIVVFLVPAAMALLIGRIGR